MANSFYERPILNSPYAPPSLYHRLDDNGQPLEGEPIKGRRPSKFIVPVPASRKKAAAAQASLDLETYTENAKINEIRGYVDAWRAIPRAADWGVTPATQRLLEHWRRPKAEWAGPRPFFCQIEAVETMIWLTEVAPRRAATRGLLDQIAKDNEEANPALFRLAMKMATGSGKTTVMAMMIAWQTINAARRETKDFSRAFLIVAPGITIKDRLRVLQPSEPGNYYDTREIVPPEMLPEIRRAEIIITNYHAFQHRETLSMPKAARSFLQGNDPEPVKTTETDAQMLSRACDKLLRFERVNVINDEAHHCYRHKVGGDAEGALTGDEKKEAEENEEAARLWINGIEALDRQLKKGKRTGGVRAVYDLSATPFFLRGSGYIEGTLFPWVVSDFSLIDAIESGIVKLPRVPVTDNLVQTDTVVYRDLWKHIGKSMPKTTAGANKLSPFDLNPLLLTALNSLYSHYAGEFERWQRAGIGVPPVFIVVCQNTAISKLVFEWIAGFERGEAQQGERAAFHAGHLELFRNYDEHGGRLPRPRTLLIDSRQLEAGEALDKTFKDAASAEIEQFKRELAAREGAGSVKGDVSEGDLLREVMNTVGRVGRLGEQIRCVVSVSMLTEGWDTNTVTHILGVRAFGTQLLCEQVVGRGLRRQSYELNKDGLFDVEYADIMGIPFDFARSPQKVDNPKPPKPVTRVHAIAERADLEIRFPRVSGYRRELPSERLEAQFDEDSRLVITPEDIGPTSVTMEGIVGAGVTITPEVLAKLRPSEISFNLAKHLLYTHFRDEDGFPKQHLFPQIQRLARRWIDEGYLITKGVPIGAILYQEQLARAAEKIDIACTRGGGGHIVAVLDPYNPGGSTRHVNFITTKECWKTGAQPPRSQISHVVKDSSWEVALAQALEGHDRVIAYAKNQALGFEIPYLDGGTTRRYLPDFIVRLDAGGPEPLHLVLEMKGMRDESDKAKAQTARDLWVPGVNALGGYGRWAFAEFTDPYTTEDEFAALVNYMIDGVAA
ncbi:DEAD/DEAH box helicase family protein (plasmid) [Sphingomonas aliaeris]|uniref:DEAD/DEAH box helicase family protein n=1 Tax=Sphingomonas aliaeris TaxID=2759526 RepID=A0A974S5Y9_9SPHN|nr:DEAD/DEAH box helicase family protein [Sphingomonas aliaeris]QQV79258.1 DEAD/DEAH box helicase family protein [Sphingomonas aliaeris]